MPSINSRSPVFIKLKEILRIQEDAVPENTKRVMKFGLKVNDLLFLLKKKTSKWASQFGWVNGLMNGECITVFQTKQIKATMSNQSNRCLQQPRCNHDTLF